MDSHKESRNLEIYRASGKSLCNHKQWRLVNTIGVALSIKKCSTRANQIQFLGTWLILKSCCPTCKVEFVKYEHVIKCMIVAKACAIHSEWFWNPNLHYDFYVLKLVPHVSKESQHIRTIFNLWIVVPTEANKNKTIQRLCNQENRLALFLFVKSSLPSIQSSFLSA